MLLPGPEAQQLATYIGLQRFKWNMVPVIIGSAAAGYIWKTFIVI
jgi:chromate transport protein ChrA